MLIYVACSYSHTRDVLAHIHAFMLRCLIVYYYCHQLVVYMCYDICAMYGGSTGRGLVTEDLECSHYGRVTDAPYKPLRYYSS
jgi:hypothetical protein